LSPAQSGDDLTGMIVVGGITEALVQRVGTPPETRCATSDFLGSIAEVVLRAHGIPDRQFRALPSSGPSPRPGIGRRQRLFAQVHVPGGPHLRSRSMRRSDSFLPPVWQCGQYWSDRSAKDTSAIVVPHTGHSLPVRP